MHKAHTIVSGSRNGSIAITTTTGMRFPGGTGIQSTSVDGYQYRAPVAMNIRTLRVVAASTTGTGRECTVYKNGATTALTATLADGGSIGDAVLNTGVSIPLAVDDKFNYAVRRTNTGGTSQIHCSVVLETDNGLAAQPHLCSHSGSTITTITNRRLPLAGSLTFSNTTDETVTALKAATSGIWKGLGLYVSANASSGTIAVVFTAEKNNAAQSMAVSVGVGETGYFYDFSNTVSYVEDDYLDFAVTSTGTGSASVTIISMFSTTISNNRYFNIYDSHSRALSTSQSDSWFGIQGGDPGTTSPYSLAKEYTLEFDVKIDKFRARVLNGYDVAVDIYVWVDGVKSALGAQIAASTTAIIEDNTNVLTLNAGQKVILRAQAVSTPTTGTINFAFHDLRFLDNSQYPDEFPKITWTR